MVQNQQPHPAGTDADPVMTVTLAGADPDDQIVKRQIVPPVSLDEEASEFNAAASTFALRKDIAGKFQWLFGISNAVVLAFVCMIAVMDQVNLANKVITPAERLVDKEVVLALLAATATQLGVIMYLITRYIFPQTDPGKPGSGSP